MTPGARGGRGPSRVGAPAVRRAPIMRGDDLATCDVAGRTADRLVLCRERWLRGRIALGRVARADELASAILFLLGREASFITGAALPVDGGLLAGLAVGLPE